MTKRSAYNPRYLKDPDSVASKFKWVVDRIDSEESSLATANIGLELHRIAETHKIIAPKQECLKPFFPYSVGKNPKFKPSK